MRSKSSTLGPCDICRKPVSELGSYIKMALGHWAHGQCFYDTAYDKGRIDGRKAVVQEIEKAQRIKEESDRREELERRERERAMEERRAEVAERERTNRIEAQRAMPLPPRVDRETAARRAIAEGKSVTLGDKEPERPKSRFELIELDEPGEEK